MSPQRTASGNAPAGDSDLVLSFDLGTSAVKISVLDRSLTVLDSAKEEYPYILLPGEKVEEDPAVLWKAVCSACGSLRADLRARVGLVCYDSFSPSLMLMDDAGDALYNVVTHMDRRSRRQLDFICETMGKEKYQSISGVYPFAGGISLTSLLWFMQEMPDLMRKVRKIGHLPTFLHKRMTGIWAVDLVNASMMGVYDTIGQTGWSDEIVAAFGLDRNWLSPIHEPGEPLGTLLPDAAGELGLPAGVPVAMGTNDVVSSHAGAGNDRHGQILNTAGSSDMVSILTDRPVLNPNYYVRNAGTRGLWQIYATTAGGFAIEWFYQEFCGEMDKDRFYNEFIPEAIALIDGNPVEFDPYLAEDRQSLERRTASWRGLTLGSTKKHMFAALIYSMQKVLSDTVALAAQTVDIEPVIKVTGGMTADSVMELKRKMFPGYSFVLKDDCAILGNATMALRHG